MVRLRLARPLRGAARDSDGDGAADAYDAHPGEPSEIDGAIARIVLDHRGKPGLISAEVGYDEAATCRVTLGEAVALIVSQQRHDDTPDDLCRP